MPVQFIDPRGETIVQPDPYRLAAALDGPLTVGLLANGFPDSVAFLDQVEASMRQALPHLSWRRYDKGDASAIASDQLLAGIAAECHAVVTAYGH